MLRANYRKYFGVGKLETLEAFTYKTFHSDFVRKRKEWVQKFGKAFFALWWLDAGETPTIDECLEKPDISLHSI